MSDNRRVVIVGSGPTGAIAAQELVKRGVPVTMLESGDSLQPGLLVRVSGRNYYRRVPAMENGRRHVATGDPKTDWYVNLAPGGLSNQWTGAVPRFAPEDFTEGERLHECYRWPLDYADLAPYYESVERRMHITADNRDVPQLPAGYAEFHHSLPPDWQDVAGVAAAHGQGLTTMPLADGPPALVVGRGTAFNSFTNLVRPLLASPLFELRTGAHALRLEWNGTKRRVDSVLYHSRRDGSQQKIEAEAVIVACGALHSTKLLFDSACGDFPEGLGNAAGVLGRYLHDHPREWWVFDMERPASLLSPSAYLTRLPYAASPPLLAAAWTLGVVTTKDKIRSRLGQKGTAVGVQVFGTMVPSEKYYARPTDAKQDEFGLPVLDLHIRYDDDVISHMIAARKHLLCLMEDAGIGRVCGKSCRSCLRGSSVHYGGSARMHTSPKYGVLDGWNRLHDAPNVLVCDASCFTTGAEKNPTLTAMALAARAADRLATDLKTRT